MKFSYVYRTSDGIRREGVIEAATRDAAFATLRAKGIRPMKVFSLSGSKANGEERIVTRKRFVFAALVLGILVGAAVAVWAVNRDWRDRRLVLLEQRAKDLLAHNEYILGTLNLGELRDYEQIRAGKGMMLAEQKIALAYCTLDGARRDVRELFRGPVETFSGDPSLLSAAERLYAKAMDAVDLHEGHFAREVKAYRLLVKNVGKWKIENGWPVFDDAEMADAYADLTRALFTRR